MLSIERFVVKMMTGQPPQGRPLRASPASNPNRASSTPSVDHSLWNEVLLSCLRPPGDPVQGISGASLFDYKLALSDTSVAASLTGQVNEDRNSFGFLAESYARRAHYRPIHFLGVFLLLFPFYLLGT